MEKVIIYGCGGNYRYALLNGMIDSYEVVAYSDSNPKLWGVPANNSKVIPPENINDYSYDAVYVTSAANFGDIAGTLNAKYGIPAWKIKLLETNSLDEKKFKEMESRIGILNNAVAELLIDKFERNNKLVKIEEGEEKGRDINEIESFWTDHTVHDDYFVSAKESQKYCYKRFDMYPMFRELAGMDLSHDGEIVLDYGCGPGNDLTWYSLQNNLKSIIGMDVSLTALKLSQYRMALHNISNVRLIHKSEGDTHIPLDDESVDFVNCQGVLMHTSSPGEILKEFYRVLHKKPKVSPHVSIMVYNKDSIWYHLYAAYFLRFVDNTYLINSGVDKAQMVDVDEIFKRSTDTVNCPKASCFRSDEFCRMCSSAGFSKVDYRGGYPNNLEPGIARRYLQMALEDERLEDEHKAFLKEVTYDEKGYPMYDGKYCCIGGTYQLWV